MAPYHEHAPPPALAQYIECAWSIAAAGPVTGHRVPPDGCLDIIYSRTDGARVVGAMTAEQRFDFPPGTMLAGVRFRPGMAGLFLGVAPAELTDRIAPLDDIWGSAGRSLAGRLDGAATAAECIRLITAALPAVRGAPGPVRCAIEAITAAHGAVDLEWIARQANLSPRQFRRRCLEESGLTPKHLCRVLRFRYACARAASGERRWPEIAAEAGYFDQAHLIRDFREFTKQTPMAVFSKTSVGTGSSIKA